MQYWMFGAGSDIPKSLALLKDLGFQAVVGNNPALIEEARRLGLAVYLCSGAYGASAPFDGEEYLARDINGNPQLWFGSTCPNQPEVRHHNLAQIADMARTKGIRGVFIDGARFASPASSPVTDALYTCFCPVCEEKAKRLGFDFVRMQAAVRVLYDNTPAQGLSLILDHMAGLADWLAFRRVCTSEHLQNFARTVKEVNPALETGIFIFTPSLAALVGQHYGDLRGYIDIFSPMIYRHYQAQQGPACLNFELSVLADELSKRLLPFERVHSLLHALTGLDMAGFTDPDSIRERGFAPSAVASETRKARQMIGDAGRLIPIIQLKDECLDESMQQAAAGGADGVNFFVYQDDTQLRPASFAR
jgi:hypothetical protein